MSGRGKVKSVAFPNGLQSPSPSPKPGFNLADSQEDLSDKEKSAYGPYASPHQPTSDPWSSRPKSTPWTSRPQSLRERLRPRWWRDIIIDTFAILMPLPFFILSGIVLVLDGEEADAGILSILSSSIKTATTIYPIFFAGLTGRAAIRFATWKLEQGTSLGLLEQLMGSRTVISTITTQIRLRTFNLIGLALVALWLLSPLGSQAVLNILQSPLAPKPSSALVTYFNSRAQSYSAPSGAFKNTWYYGFTMLFGASLLSPVSIKTSDMDLWENVKIPYFSSVLNASPAPDADGWTYLPDDFRPTYSSLFGIPISGVLPGNTTFTMESSYLTLRCGNLSISPAPEGSNSSKSSLISPNGPYLSSAEVVESAPWALGYQGPDIAQYNGTILNNTDTYLLPQACPDCLSPEYVSGSFDPGMLLYQEFDDANNATSIFCTPSQVYLESMIKCKVTSNTRYCKVIAQRPSKLAHMPTTITPLSFRPVALGLSSLLPNSTPQYTATNPVQSFLYDPTSQTGIISGTSSIGLKTVLGQKSPISRLSMTEFSDRFGQIVNTYLFASVWNVTAYLTGAPFSGLEGTLLGGNPASFVSASPRDLENMIQNRTSAFTVPATLTTNIRVYKVSYPWMAVFLLATLAMMFSAIAGVLFSRNTVVPDYLGYVSTLAKESQFVRVPNGGANLDGMERSRLMKHMRVRLGNVDEGRGEVGRLAFARVEDTGVVRKDSFYV